jgi:hypothetical protein
MLKAVPRVGQFNDAESEAMLAKFLIDRRDAIVKRYLPAVNPIVDVRLAATGLTFRNAAVDAGVAPAPQEAVVNWLQFDNATGETKPLGTTSAAAASMSVPAPQNLPSAPASYIRAEIAFKGGPESWTEPAHAYFQRAGNDWKLVGFERAPGGNPPKERRR